MCIRDRREEREWERASRLNAPEAFQQYLGAYPEGRFAAQAVSYTHLRAHETVLDLVCRLLLEKKKKHSTKPSTVTLTQEKTHISLLTCVMQVHAKIGKAAQTHTS